MIDVARTNGARSTRALGAAAGSSVDGIGENSPGHSAITFSASIAGAGTFGPMATVVTGAPAQLSESVPGRAPCGARSGDGALGAKSSAPARAKDAGSRGEVAGEPKGPIAGNGEGSGGTTQASRSERAASHSSRSGARGCGPSGSTAESASAADNCAHGAGGNADSPLKRVSAAGHDGFAAATAAGGGNVARPGVADEPTAQGADGGLSSVANSPGVVALADGFARGSSTATAGVGETPGKQNAEQEGES